MRTTRLALPLAGALLLAACGGDRDRVGNEAAEANAAADMNAMTADANNPFAGAEMRMHDAMMAAGGADVSETWVRKMIEHHRGAIAMADVLLAQPGISPAVRAEAERTKAEQEQEIARLERMLRGEAYEAAGQPRAPATAARSAPAERPPAATPPRRPAPATEKPAEPADPHAGHDMNNMH